MKYVVPVLAVLLMAAGTIYFFVAPDDEAIGTDPAAPRTPLVCSTLYPLHYFVQRIAGDLAQAECVVPPGEDPLHWHPDPAAAARLQQADLLVFNGAGAEPWTYSLALPLARVVETAAVLDDDLITIPDAVTHSHGPGGTHTHEGLDPHTWMDPRNAKRQAEQVWKGLRRVLRREHDALDAGHRALMADLDALHQELAGLGALPEGEVLVASHPAYDYLARRHGWAVVNLDLDPSRPLSAGDLAAVRERLARHRARFILWEEEPAPALARQVESELGLRGIVFTPCETPPGAGEPDYLAAMRANVARLAAAFR